MSSFLNCMLKWKPKDRKSARDLLNHPWLKESNDFNVWMSKNHLKEFKTVNHKKFPGFLDSLNKDVKEKIKKGRDEESSSSSDSSSDDKRANGNKQESIQDEEADGSGEGHSVSSGSESGSDSNISSPYESGASSSDDDDDDSSEEEGDDESNEDDDGQWED